MATLHQLLKVHEQVGSVQTKLNGLRNKRVGLIKKLGLHLPTIREDRSESFITIDGKPCRLWIDWTGEVTLEELVF